MMYKKSSPKTQEKKSKLLSSSPPAFLSHHPFSPTIPPFPCKIVQWYIICINPSAEKSNHRRSLLLWEKDRQKIFHLQRPSHGRTNDHSVKKFIGKMYFTFMFYFQVRRGVGKPNLIFQWRNSFETKSKNVLAFFLHSLFLKEVEKTKNGRS